MCFAGPPAPSPSLPSQALRRPELSTQTDGTLWTLWTSRAERERLPSVGRGLGGQEGGNCAFSVTEWASCLASCNVLHDEGCVPATPRSQVLPELHCGTSCQRGHAAAAPAGLRVDIVLPGQLSRAESRHWVSRDFARWTTAAPSPKLVNAS